MESPDSLAQRLQLDRAVVLGALNAYTQAGRAIWDLNRQVYRVRELSREPLPMDKLRFANEREKSATQLLDQNSVHISSRNVDDRGVVSIEGTVTVRGKRYSPRIRIDNDERLMDATCNCNWYQQNRLRQGPCECTLALRMQFAHEKGGQPLVAASD